ncbi:uncharacterized protein LOC135941461 [Cloeon dipterum]|uniref:uncharacterized protein LOC135941461 n=1 Tax=Cloeon dipterum TaxID=197152 RepID=UPI0032205577
MMWWVWLFCTVSAGSTSLINPNANTRPGGGFGRGNSFEQDLAAVFNRVAHGSTAAPVNTTAAPVVTTPSPPPTPQAASTAIPSLQSLVPDPPDFVNRPRFKPPLPPEYNNPFADKGILRGSQSEGPATGSGRRQNLPPKPQIPLPDIQQRIPYRPPDLPPQVDRKKPLNTPSNPDPTANDVTRINDTDPSESPSVPVLQVPIITRIMSEHQTPQEDRPADNKSQPKVSNSSSSRVSLDDVNKDSMIDIKSQPTTSRPANKDESPKVVTEQPPREAPESWPQQIGLLAWDIVVYTLASLFALLALYTFLVSPFRATDSLISHGSYCFLHLFLFVIGVSRSAFLFYDAYNLRGTFIPILESIALDMAFPCLFAAFAILFFSIARMTKVQLCHSTFQSATFLSLIVVLNMLLFGLLEWTAQILDLIEFLVSALRALPLLSLLIAALSFVIAFRCIYRAARRLQGDVLRANFAKMGAMPRRPQLKLAARLILAAALLILVLCPVHAYVLFSERDLVFWCCQLAARVLELCVACLLAAVAWLRRSEVPNNRGRLCCCCFGSSDSKSVDDLFPAICSKNNAIHNYSLHTGKAVYEHANTLKPIYPRPTPTSTTAASASLKRPPKSGTMPSQRQQHRSSQHIAKPSDPMLFPDELHYRPKEHDAAPQSRTMARHEALTAFNLSEDCYQVNNRRSDSLGDVRDGRGRRLPRGKAHHQSARHCYQKSLLDPPDSPSNLSSYSGGSSSDLSESDLTSGGYERVRVANHNRKNVRAARYQTAS